MTVSSQTPINRSTGNGVTTVFPYGFKIISEADIEVTVDGVVKTLNVDYTVSGVGNEAGGNVTMTAAPANLASVVRRRNMALVRTIDYQDQGEMPATTLDADIDNVVLMVQQVNEQIGRALIVPPSLAWFSGELPSPVGSNVIGWKPDGTGLQNYGPADSSLLTVALAASSGSSLVGYTAAGTGAVARTIQSKLRESVSVKDFGAVGDGSTDDTAAIQACINAVMDSGGGTVYFPSTALGYKIASSLVIDYSGAFYNTSRFGKKINIKGDGSASTFLTYTGSSQALYLKGNSTDNTAYFEMEGVRLAGTGNLGVGLLWEKVAYAQLEDVIVETFLTGCYFIDTEQIAIYDTEIRYNNYGLYSDVSTITSPNSWSFYNTLIAGNRQYGANLHNVNGFNYNGGSVQYNGLIGGGTGQFGILLTEAGNGYGTVGFTNTAFEGNGGLADFVSVQDTNPCNISFDNVGFMRTGSFASSLVTGTANNGAGAIRLMVNATNTLSGAPKVYVCQVGGTTEANNAIPWSYTIVDATHIDLIGSTYTNAYTSGGKVVCVGFATYNVYLEGTQANAIYGITNSSFRSELHYLPSATRPTIGLANTSCKISDDGTNYFQNATEKLTYPQAQKIGDDGAVWETFTPTATAEGGTFTATATGKYKKIGKTVHFSALVTTTTWAATPTAPLTVTLPLPVATSTAMAVFNNTATANSTGIASAGLSNVRIWKDGTFPIGSAVQTLVVSGTYETT